MQLDNLWILDNPGCYKDCQAVFLNSQEIHSHNYMNEKKCGRIEIIMNTAQSYPSLELMKFQAISLRPGTLVQLPLWWCMHWDPRCIPPNHSPNRAGKLTGWVFWGIPVEDQGGDPNRPIETRQQQSRWVKKFFTHLSIVTCPSTHVHSGPAQDKIDLLWMLGLMAIQTEW